MVTFSVPKTLATKCDALQGTDSFWSKMGWMRLLGKTLKDEKRAVILKAICFQNHFPLGVKRKLF